MQGILSINGVMVADDIVRRFFKHKYQTLLNKLTVHTRQRIGPPKIAKIYKYTVAELDGKKYKMIHLPRTVGEGLLDKGIIDELINTIPDGHDVELDFQAELFENQQLVVDHLLEHKFNKDRTDDGFGTAVLNMQAGLGKSFTAGGLIKALGKKALFITINKKLKKQGLKDLQACFPNNKVWDTDGAKNAMTLADNVDIMVMVINSALTLPDEFFAKFGTIIIDEVHMVCSKSRAELFWKCQVRNVLGMSATTSQRDDGFDAVYYKHLGEPVIAADIPGFTSDDTEFKGNVKVVKYFASDEAAIDTYNETTGYIDFNKMLAQFIVDEQRNKLCVDEIIELLNDPDAKRYIFAFSDRVEHLKTIEVMLQQRLADNNLIFAPELVIMKGGASDQTLGQADSARIILTTYGFSGTGVSIVHMNSIVLMTPRRKGFLQILPRAMRRGSDIEIVRKFVDIVDAKTKIKSQLSSRKNAYKHYKFDIDVVKVNKKD